MKFQVRHKKNLGRHLRPVDQTYRDEQLAEKLLENSVKSARFRINGAGSYTFDEAVQECVIQDVLFGRQSQIELISV